MLYIAENLKSLRKLKAFTQEEIAEILGVAPQSVSKWERGETYPDITLLPALANLYKTSIDALIGMDKINDNQSKEDIFNTSHEYFWKGNYNLAISILSEALKIFPNDKGFMSELAIALALDGGKDELSQAVTLCERILSDNTEEKICHTTRAALCFIFLKAGQKEKAIISAKKLPHIRESRETILKQLENEPNMEDIDKYLKVIAIGDNEQQEIIKVEFGLNMVVMCTEHGLIEKMQTLRKEINAPHTDEGYRKLPIIRMRDNKFLAPNQIQVRYYADYLLNREFEDLNEAMNEVIATIHKIVQFRMEHVILFPL